MNPYTEQMIDITERYQEGSEIAVAQLQCDFIFSSEASHHLHQIQTILNLKGTENKHFKTIRFYGGLTERDDEDQEIVHESLVPLYTDIPGVSLVTGYYLKGKDVQIHLRRAIPYLQNFEMAVLTSQQCFKTGRDGPLFEKEGLYGMTVKARVYCKKEERDDTGKSYIVADEERRKQMLEQLSLFFQDFRALCIGKK